VHVADPNEFVMRSGGEVGKEPQMTCHTGVEPYGKAFCLLRFTGKQDFRNRSRRQLSEFEKEQSVKEIEPL
jgi:hypothetical protein